MKKMNTRLFKLCFLILILSCKSTSLVSDYGVEKKDEFFSLAVLPDTQYYTGMRYGGTMQMFQNQVDWIVKNKKKENIAYVIHLGDITDKNTEPEWERAAHVMSKLDKHNVPYGMTVGNHDQLPAETFMHGDGNTLYNKYFGKNRFSGKHWYGGSFENDGNDNHYDLFEAQGMRFLVMYFDYNETNKRVKVNDTAYQRRVFQWADSIIDAYKDRKVILVAHSVLNRGNKTESHIKAGTGDNSERPNFTQQGRAIYNMAKNHPNVFLMLGGHISGEAFRKDTFNGNVIKTYLTDYQARQSPPYRGPQDRNGGNGNMRLMRFNKTKQTLSVITFAPQADGSVVKEEDEDSQFTQPLFK